MICHWFGWISLIMLFLTLCSYLVRRSQNSTLKHFLRGKHHRIWGILMIFFGALHGIMSLKHSLVPKGWRHQMHASALASPSLHSGGHLSAILAVNISGVICLLAAVFLLVTFLKRKELKQKWFKWHKLAAVLLICLTALHLLLRFSLLCF